MRTLPLLPRRVMLGASLMLALPALATGQSQLYDAPPPPGSAWLRFINTLGVPVALRPDFSPARELGTDSDSRVGHYTVVERVAGRRLGISLMAAGQTGTASLSLEPGSFTTVLLHAAAATGIAATAVTDNADFNRARAKLGFYNAAPGCAVAELRLDPGGAPVFQGLAPLAVQTRAVTPVAASVVALCNGVALAPVALTTIEAGNSYSVWLMQPPGAAPFAFFAPDTLARRAS